MGVFDKKYELVVADIPYLRQVLESCKKLADGGMEIAKVRDHFFMMALVGYYDCMWAGMNRDVGHVVYRLADLFDENIRKEIMIYPSGESDDRWYSLEDWRKEWEKAHPVIPEFDFTKKLNEPVLRLLGG